MGAICLREFTSLFKSVRSIVIILIMVGFTVYSANFLGDFEADLKEMGADNIYAAGLMLISITLGPLFVTSLSHDVVNKEVQSRTVRFIIPKLSRNKIILGKFLGVLLFWFLCIFISFAFIMPFSNAFYYEEFIQSVIFYSYFVSLSVLLSTLINKTRLSMFYGMILAVLMPIFGIWAAVSDTNRIMNMLGYINPYFFFMNDNSVVIYFVPLFVILFLIVSLFIFRRKDF